MVDEEENGRVRVRKDFFHAVSSHGLNSKDVCEELKVSGTIRWPRIKVDGSAGY